MNTLPGTGAWPHTVLACVAIITLGTVRSLSIVHGVDHDLAILTTYMIAAIATGASVTAFWRGFH